MSEPKPPSCNDDCPVRRTAAIIDHKWTTLIVRDLLGGAKRYAELQQSLHGISAKVLSQRLRFLERHGIISRTVFPTIPPGTEYALTPLGRGLEGVIMAMQAFGETLD